MDTAPLLLSLNVGSTSLKAALFAGMRADTPRLLRRMERHRASGASAEAVLLDATAALALGPPPRWIVHRVVHGGDATAPQRLDAVEMARLQALAALAPMHQPAALDLARSAAALWPQALQYAVYDTLWHLTLPDLTRRLPVPAAWEALGVRRYGFHGLAFASAMRALREQAPDAAHARVVFAHLGGGASLCAVRDGRSIDTTMGSTPLDGLPMTTRSGSLDPGVLLMLLHRPEMSVEALQHALYRESGLRGLSGLSGDVRELLASASPAARLALEAFALRTAQGIAAMATALGGVDHLVFSGGIGSRSAPARAMIAAHLEWLGARLCEAANTQGRTRLDGPGAGVAVWRIEVDEESEMARACAAAAATGTLALD